MFKQASGDSNKLIHIWDAGPMTLLHTFKGHRDAISVSDVDVLFILIVKMESSKEIHFML
jgi:hypothetical protein